LEEENRKQNSGVRIWESQTEISILNRWVQGCDTGRS
jgi:hypothetical protein